MPGQRLDIHIAYRKLVIHLPTEGNRKGILFVVYQHILRHDRYERFSICPVPRDYEIKMNKKERRLALKSALTSRVQENKLIVLDDLKLDEVKTKAMQAVLSNLNVSKAMVVLADNDQNVVLSARNIPNVITALPNTINVYDVLKYNTVILTKSAVASIEEVYA